MAFGGASLPSELFTETWCFSCFFIICGSAHPAQQLIDFLDEVRFPAIRFAGCRAQLMMISPFFGSPGIDDRFDVRQFLYRRLSFLQVPDYGPMLW